VKALVTGATGFVGGRLAAALAEDGVEVRCLVRRPSDLGHEEHAPAWLRTRTQPIGADDVIAYLRAAPRVPESAGREVQIGGPDVLSYGDMLRVVARSLGKREPAMLPVPLLSPALSSLWIGLVTPVDAGVARPLIEGLSTETVVSDPAGAELFDVEPAPFPETVRRALA
jgi:uncharacterized protein YbjT (DUF2867 family)